ncbi:TRAP transporter large permease [Ahrensia kielensis]|uniref:TRAP transporter large permease protein n=1 Tax=Ahrensia kielensis TaxID=76980 RepID=A0ABU9T2R3_9HYPH
MTVALLVGGLLLLAALGVPLVFAIMASSIVTILVTRPGLPLEVVAQTFVGGIDSSVLLAILFFFLAGELMNCSGITRRIVEFSATLVGHIRGGLGQVNVLSSLLFSGISGSAIADTAAVGTVMIPAMKERGYSAGFAAALTQTSSIVGPIIPPSVPMIIYAILAEQSVGELFVAGIVPGFCIAAALMFTVYIISRKRGYERAEKRAGISEITSGGARASAALMMPIIIVGGILGGVMTATEAGAVAVLYAVVIGLFVYRELTPKLIWHSMLRAAKGASTVLVILGASSLFAWLVADQQINKAVAEVVLSISTEPVMVLVLITLVGLLVGMLMDPLAALIILVPVFLPVTAEVGIDPVHFGLVIVLTLMIGLCTPPVGYLIYLSAIIAKTRPEVVVRESMPFILCLVIVLGLCLFFPQLSLTLPEMFGYRG